MLPSTNIFCKLWIQESSCLKLEALRLCVSDSPLDHIHDKNAASIGPQICGNDSIFPKLLSIKKPGHKKIHYVNEVVEQCCHQQTMSAEDGKWSTFVFSCKLSLWAPNNPLDRINDKNVVSNGPLHRISHNKQNVLVQKIQNVIEVVRQLRVPQTEFMSGRKERLHISNLRLSNCGRNKNNWTGSTTSKWHL